MARCEIRELADVLCRSHGKGLFNLSEAGKILNLGKNNVKEYLEREGVLVKKLGKNKYVNAYQLAEFMCSERISAIDTTSRGSVLGVKVEITTGDKEAE